MPLIVSPQAAGLPPIPYLTVDEYLASPAAIDTSALMADGSPAQQVDVLANEIMRASSWMDRQVHYVLGATQDTETARARIDRSGCVRVVARGIPILEVDTFLLGMSPGTMGAIDSAAAANAWVEDNVIWMPAYPGAGRDGVFYGAARGLWCFCQWTYVNGYPNTIGTAPMDAGDESIEVQSALGIYAGTNLTIYDSGSTELVVVDGSYAGGTTLPLVSGLRNGHPQGVSVSSMPATLKEAAVLVTNAFIRTRGEDVLSISSMDATPAKLPSGSNTGDADLQRASSMLSTFVLPTWG